MPTREQQAGGRQVRTEIWKVLTKSGPLDNDSLLKQVLPYFSQGRIGAPAELRRHLEIMERAGAATYDMDFGVWSAGAKPTEVKNIQPQQEKPATERKAEGIPAGQVHTSDRVRVLSMPLSQENAMEVHAGLPMTAEEWLELGRVLGYVRR